VPIGRYADETPFALAVTRMYDNLDLNLIRTDGLTFLDDLDDLFFHLERPFGSTSNRIWIEAILKEARHQGIGVMLNGAQGNLTFSRDGSGRMPQLLRTGKWMQALREARLLARHGSSRSVLREWAGKGIMPLLPAPLRRAVERLRGNLPAFSDRPLLLGSPINPDFAEVHRVGERARDWVQDDSFRQDVDSRRQNLKGLMLQDLGLFDTLFRTMHSVDLRTPPADRRIAEFCLALPEEQFMHDGESRSLIRRAMAGLLPLEVISNRLRGLQAADWFERLTRIRSELPAELDRLDRCDLARRTLDLARMRRLVKYWPRGTCGSNPNVFEYQVILERGLMAGRFLRWFESGG
jgi:asparagine synthase (glutamine-hydrolysing)